MLDVVIIHHNTLDLTVRCLESLYASAARSIIAELIVVDNASTDGSGFLLAERFPSIRLLRSEAMLSYAAACNWGARVGTAPYVLLSNSDVEYDPPALSLMIEHMKRYSFVAVGCPQQRYPSGRLQRSWGYFPGWSEIVTTLFGLEFFRHHACRRSQRWRAVPYCDGAVLLCRRDAYEQIGGMDERFSFFGEDVDLCYRLWRHGWHCHFIPSATVIHHRGGTRQNHTDAIITFEQKNMAAKLQFVAHHVPRMQWAVRQCYLLVTLYRAVFYWFLRRLGIIDAADYHQQRLLNDARLKYLRSNAKKYTANASTRVHSGHSFHTRCSSE